jgi:hypothetical protein
MEKIELTNEINIKKKLQFAIINILYKNNNKEFTKETLYNELNNNDSIFNINTNSVNNNDSIFNINTNSVNNNDNYIIYSFIWNLLLKKNSNFIINRDDKYIKININYYKTTKEINNEIPTNYLIKHIIKYFNIYIILLCLFSQILYNL